MQKTTKDTNKAKNTTREISTSNKKRLNNIKERCVSTLSPSKFDKHTIDNFKKITSSDSEISADEKQRMLKNITLTYWLENNHSLMDSIPDKYVWLAFQFKEQIIKDYNCKTHLEKSLVDTIVISYCKILNLTNQLNESIKFEFYWKDRNWFLNFLSKEIDRATRQQQSSIESLKRLKTPDTWFKLTLKTNNLFMGQNQEINNQNK